jgi:hypothetical protein
MLADDAGWFRWNVDEIAAELYRYEPIARRESNTRRYMARLVEVGRVEVEPCGHATIPTLTTHQRFSGETKKVYTIRNEHTDRCVSPTPQEPAGSRGESPMPAWNGTYLVGMGKGSDVPDDDARAVAQRLLANSDTPEHLKKAARKSLGISDSEAE